MDRSVNLLERAYQCRRLAQGTTDARATAVLIETAESYEQQAKTVQRHAEDRRPLSMVV